MGRASMIACAVLHMIHSAGRSHAIICPENPKSEQKVGSQLLPAHVKFS